MIMCQTLFVAGFVGKGTLSFLQWALLFITTHKKKKKKKGKERKKEEEKTTMHSGRTITLLDKISFQLKK